MNNIIKWLITSIIFIAIGSGFFCLCWFTGANVDTYSGTMAFNTQEELVQFKNAIVQEDITIIKLNELNSSYPIVVTFEIDVNRNIHFNYGEKESIANDIFVGLIVGIVIVTILTTFIYTCVLKNYFKDLRKEE